MAEGARFVQERQSGSFVVVQPLGQQPSDCGAQAVIGVWVMPVLGSHTSFVQATPSSMGRSVFSQTPAAPHASAVQAFLSLQSEGVVQRVGGAASPEDVPPFDVPEVPEVPEVPDVPDAPEELVDDVLASPSADESPWEEYVAHARSALMISPGNARGSFESKVVDLAFTEGSVASNRAWGRKRTPALGLAYSVLETVDGPRLAA